MHVVPVPDLYRGEHRREDPAALDKYLAAAREVVLGARQGGRKVRARPRPGTAVCLVFSFTTDQFTLYVMSNLLKAEEKLSITSVAFIYM